MASPSRSCAAWAGALLRRRQGVRGQAPVTGRDPVSRFRRSYHPAGRTFTNVGNNGAPASLFVREALHLTFYEAPAAQLIGTSNAPHALQSSVAREQDAPPAAARADTKQGGQGWRASASISARSPSMPSCSTRP